MGGEGLVSVFRNKYDCDLPPSVPLEDIVAACVAGVYRGRKLWRTIDRVRAAATEEERDRWKSKLPGVTVSATFRRPADYTNGKSHRQKACMATHNGVMGMDVDKLTAEQVERLFLRLIRNPNVVYALRSPSGHGIKYGIRVSAVPANAEEHRAQYERLLTLMTKQLNVPTIPPVGMSAA